MIQENIDYKAVGENIKNLRLKRNMTQKMLAEALSVTQSHVSQFERGATVSDALLNLICEKLGATMDELVDSGVAAPVVIAEPFNVTDDVPPTPEPATPALDLNHISYAMDYSKMVVLIDTTAETMGPVSKGVRERVEKEIAAVAGSDAYLHTIDLWKTTGNKCLSMADFCSSLAVSFSVTERGAMNQIEAVEERVNRRKTAGYQDVLVILNCQAACLRATGKKRATAAATAVVESSEHTRPPKAPPVTYSDIGDIITIIRQVWDYTQIPVMLVGSAGFEEAVRGDSSASRSLFWRLGGIGEI